MKFKIHKNTNFRKELKAKLKKAGIVPNLGANNSRNTKFSLRKNKTTLNSSKQKPSVKKVFSWILTVFLALFALTYLPHISGIIALLAAVLSAPIEKWQNFISRYIKRKLKTIIIALTTVLAIFITPSPDLPDSPTADTLPTDIESADIALEDNSIYNSAETVIPVEIEGISFDEEICIIGIGRTADISFSLYPTNATCDTLEVTINNTDIASVSLEKKNEYIICITGISPGEATITLKSGDTITATKNITVVEIMPEAITITTNPKTLRVGTIGKFTAIFEPTDVTNQHVTWQSDTPDIVSVNDDGSFEALTIGEAIITATHEDGTIGTLQIEILPIVAETVTLNSNWENGKPFCKNDSMTLTAVIFPENAADKTLTWTSSDESVAVVSDKGIVKAISPGSAVITATTSNNKIGKYEITVDPSPQNFRISASINIVSNDHVGNSWSKGYEFNNETIYSGNIISIMPGDTFTICGWAQENDSKPDYGHYSERITLTNDMCTFGFTIEGDAYVRENGGKYSGNCAVWHVKITATPTN